MDTIIGNHVLDSLIITGREDAVLPRAGILLSIIIHGILLSIVGREDVGQAF